MAIPCQLLVSRAKELEFFLSIGPFPGSTASVKFVGKAEIALTVAGLIFQLVALNLSWKIGYGFDKLAASPS